MCCINLPTTNTRCVIYLINECSANICVVRGEKFGSTRTSEFRVVSKERQKHHYKALVWSGVLNFFSFLIGARKRRVHCRRRWRTWSHTKKPCLHFLQPSSVCMGHRRLQEEQCVRARQHKILPLIFSCLTHTRAPKSSRILVAASTRRIPTFLREDIQYKKAPICALRVRVWPSETIQCIENLFDAELHISLFLP